MSLPSSMADFVPFDRLLQKAYKVVVIVVVVELVYREACEFTALLLTSILLPLMCFSETVSYGCRSQGCLS